MLVIGISGGSGSGKTTFIRDLRSTFGHEDITLMSQDEYYRPREEQYEDLNGIRNFDLPTSIDLNAFIGDIKKLKNGVTVVRKEYTFNNEHKAPKEIIYKPCRVLITEGLFLFQDEELFNLMDLRIMIHASDAHKIIRRIMRDKLERNYPLEDVLYRYEHHVLPAYQQYIYPFIEKVDVVINNNNNYRNALKMVKGYLHYKLST